MMSRGGARFDECQKRWYDSFSYPAARVKLAPVATLPAIVDDLTLQLP
ncbi:MAG TPA: hypothetical protein VMW58_07165 [Anaerolineae bacterium]|nr:hypothetical protein [Anaerolineae bacterium]